MSLYYPQFVPDEGPVDANILFVGEAPGETENAQLKPFVGDSGALFTNCLGRNGVRREEVRLANLFHHRPAQGNKFETILKEPLLQEHVKLLYKHILTHRPNVIAALGAWPLWFLTGKKGIKKWRGSILTFLGDETIKVIPTVHPAAVLRDRGLYPIFDTDLKRIVEDSAFPERNLPVRRFICNPHGLELEEWTQRLCGAEYLGTDIETIKNSSKILCCGFAPSPDVAVCINAESHEGQRAIQRILASPAKKIFQFGTFDTIQLIALNGYELHDASAFVLDRPYYWDTLVAQHVLAPELPRSLEYLTSVYTREPYYKTVGRGSIPDDEKGWSAKVERQTLWEYNCRDCCVTIEIAFKQMQELSEEPIPTQNIFAFDMQQTGTARDISNAGILVDDERRAMLERVLLRKWAKKQFALDRLTGFTTNVRSPKLKTILYENMGLPTRRNRKGGITTDEDAIVSLITFCKDKMDSVVKAQTIMDWKVKLVVCQTVLEIRGIRQVLSNYVLKASKKGVPRARSNGRVHSTFKVGPETGRWAATKYVDGTGLNMMTLPRDPVEVEDADYEEYMKALALAEAPDTSLMAELENEPDEDDIEEDEDDAEAA